MTTQLDQLTELLTTLDDDLILIRESTTGVDKKMRAQNIRAKATTKADVGLGNADNTSDANKPISTATQSALNTKAPIASPTFTGTVTITDLAGNTTVTGTIDGRDISVDGAKLDGIEAGATDDQTAAEIKTAYESNANTNAFTDAEQSKLDGIEALADVTDTANVTAAGALMESTVDVDIKTLSLPANTTISAYGATLVDDTDAGVARGTLGLGTAAVATVTTSETDTTAGRLLKVGDFGVGAPNGVVSLGDFHDLSKLITGTWWLFDGATLNSPGGQGGAIFMHRSGGRGLWLAGDQSGKLYIKGQQTAGGSSFTPWRELWHTGNLEKTATAVDTTAGRLTKVGDFGVGETAISNAQTADLFSFNFDTIVRINGFFSLSGAWTNGPPIGSPTGVLEQKVSSFSAGVDRIHQAFYRMNTPTPGNYTVWRRYYQGGTWSVWSLDYTQADILGTVSQSAGVPTGAVIQRGSNANGEFVKYADGTMICTILNYSITDAALAVGNVFQSANLEWTYPSVFITAPATSGHPRSGTVVAGAWLSLGGAADEQNTIMRFRLTRATSRTGTGQIKLLAIGRWF